MARLALGLVGAAVAGPLGFAIGSAIGGYIDRPRVEDQEFEGPRLEDLTVGSASEGANIPIVYGTARIATNVIVADRIRETVKRQTESAGGKGSSGPETTTTTYTYSCSFAVSCGMQQGRPRRIWANRKLIYDARPTAGGVAFRGLRLTIYDGTQTDPDADLEVLIGEGNVPAYTDQAMIVFHDLPLAEFGNRVPSIEVEVVENAVQESPISTTTLSNFSSRSGSASMPFDDRRGLFYILAGGYLTAIDQFGAVVREGYIDVTISSPQFVNVLPDGNIMLMYGDDVTVINGDSWDVIHTGENSTYLTLPFVPVGDGVYYNWALFCGSVFSTDKLMMYNGKAQSFTDLGGPPVGFEWVGDPQERGLVAVGFKVMVVMRKTSGNKLHFATYDVPAAAWSTPVEYDPAYDFLDSGFFRGGVGPTYEEATGTVFWPVSESADTSQWHLLEISTDCSVLNDYTLGHVDFDTSTRYSYFHSSQSQAVYWQDSDDNINALSLINGTIRTIATLDQNISMFYCDETQGIALGTNAATFTTDELFIARLSSIDYTTGSVASIVRDLCDRVGIADGDIVTTGIDDAVEGYVVTRRSAASALIKQLRDLHFIDIAESDWQIKFVPRGGSSVATITESDMVLADAPFSITHPARIAFPRSVDLTYASQESDGQPGVASAYSYSTDSDRRMTLSVAATLTDADAAKIADRMLQSGHALKSFQFSVTEEFAYLEPADIITLTIDSESYRVRLTSVARGANGVLEMQGVEDADYNLVSYAVSRGGMEPHPGIAQAGNSSILLLDTGLLRDIDLDHPGPYLTTFTYSAGYVATSIISSADDATYNVIGGVPDEPTIGTVATPPSAETFEDWDDTNTVRVQIMTAGELSSATDSALINDGANVALYGAAGRWEVVQWGTASLVSAGVYDISHLLRGRRGTDWAIDLHEVGDLFVVIDSALLVRETLSTSAIGSSRYYKAPNVNQVEADVYPVSFEIGNNPLKPYSGSNPAAVLDGSDVDVTWTRRTRRGGTYGGPNSVTDNVGGTLSEDSEEYEIDIYDSADLGTVVRPVTSLSSAAYTYEAADIATDGVDLITDDITFKIYQISATVGRGYPATVEFRMPGIDHTITNNGAESGDLTGWTSESGAFAVRSASPDPYEGSYYFYGGAAVASSVMASDAIDVVSDGVSTTLIDSGDMRIRVDFYQNSFSGDDEGRVGVRFLDGTATLISEAWGTNRTPTSWTALKEVFTYPANTRSVQILLEATRNAGSNNDAYFDLITARSLDAS